MQRAKLSTGWRPMRVEYPRVTKASHTTTGLDDSPPTQVQVDAHNQTQPPATTDTSDASNYYENNATATHRFGIAACGDECVGVILPVNR